MVKLDYKNDKPLHEQITIGIKDLIISGALTPHEQLPSVRELSVSLTVNPNTVQRAYKTLETEGVIYSIRGKGNFVSATIEADTKQLNSLYSALHETAAELAFYGEPKEKLMDVIEDIYKERNEIDD